MVKEAKFAAPIIIAMKGHPGTGKSTLARSLASSLKFPLLDKDDVRDCTLSLQENDPSSAKLLNDMSYEAIWRLASTQLHLGLSVIIDSPLSRRAHWERLIQVASSAGARLVMVECRPSDEEEWKRRVERRGGGGDGASWHKPSSWRDMERLLEGYGGCTEYEVGETPRLVVDTTSSCKVEDVVAKVMDFILFHAAGVVPQIIHSG